MFKCNIMCNLHGRYISIGMYMPMVGLVGGGFLLTALGLWFKLLLPDDEQIKVSGLVYCLRISFILPLYKLVTNYMYI